MSVTEPRPFSKTLLGVLVVVVIVVKCIPNSYGTCIRKMSSEAEIRNALVSEAILRLTCYLLAVKYSMDRRYPVAACFIVFATEHVIQEVFCYRQNRLQHRLTSVMELLIAFHIGMYAHGAFDRIVAAGLSVAVLRHVKKGFL